MRHIKLFISSLFLFALPLFGQDLRPSAYIGRQGVITVRGGKVLGSSGGVVNISGVDIALSPSSTTYIFLDLSGIPTVSSNNTGFPTGSYFPICIATTDINNIITSFTDSRPDFFMAGGNGASSPVGSPSPFIFNTPMKFGADIGCFQGPNPYVDVRCYGARAVNPNTTPAAVGLTANCTNTLNTVTISSASTFVNGDGVVLYGCGAPHSMTTPNAPTVTPALAFGGTGTGQITTTVPAGGATTYNYEIVARDKNGGLTAVSAAGSTIVGAAALGAQTVNITSAARSNDTMTFTVPSHGFSTSCGPTSCGEVFIGGGNGLTDASFRGWYPVYQAPSGTTFTIKSFLDTRDGATTSATGGTATWYNLNRITWAAVTGAWEYYIYSDRASPGTFALIGISRPQGTANTDLTFDDFGATFTGGQSFPPYIPTTSPSSSATSDNLSTTIVSGAGTTILTLANAAGTTCPGAGCPATISIRLDAAPGILAAAIAANANGATGGTIVIPATGSNQFVVNSYLNLSSQGIAISQLGALYLNETFETKANWYGDRSPQYGDQTRSGLWQGNPLVSVNTAVPGIYNPQQFGTILEGVSLQCVSVGLNGALLALYEGGFNMTFKDLSFATSSSSGDYTGIGLEIRGKSAVQAGTNIIIDRVLFSGGNSGGDGSQHTPIFFCNDCGQGQIRSAYHLHRGDAIIEDPSGGSWRIDHAYINGGTNPLFTVVGGNNSIILGQITLDTFAHPCVEAFSITAISGGCSPASGVPPFTGLHATITNFSAADAASVVPNRDSFGCQTQNSGTFDGIFNGPLANVTNQAFTTCGFNVALLGGVSYPIAINGLPVAAPTCSVQAGGSLPVATYTFAIVPVWQNNGEGNYSQQSTACTTSSGNQQITVNWTIAAGNPKGMRLYFNSSGAFPNLEDSNYTDPFPVGTTSVVWTTRGSSPKVSAGKQPTAGPTMLMPGTQGIAAPAEKFGTPVVDIGTTATLTGTGACVTGSLSAQTSGAMAGIVTCGGTTGASTLVIAPGGTNAAHGFACSADDETTAANKLTQTAQSATNCTLSGTVNANDVIRFIVHYAF